MRILVDGDACPVVSIVEKTAKKYEIPVILLCDAFCALRRSQMRFGTAALRSITAAHF